MNAHFKPNIVWYPEKPQPCRNTVVIWSPEVVCHDDKTYGSWNAPVTDVHIDQADSESECKFVKMSCSHPGIYRVDTICKYVDPNCLEIQLVLTNLSEQLWQNAYAEACIQLATAPDFRYTDGAGVFYASTDGIRHFAKEFMPVNEWGCQFLKDPEVPFEHPLMMVPSACAKYTFGHAFSGSGTIFGNGAPRIHCVHSYRPAHLPTLEPGQSTTQTGLIFVAEGGPSQALEYYLKWQGQ